LDWLKFLGFLNQITGIREINRLELDTIEHFIFSNDNCKLEETEKHMLQDWWDRAVVSAVSTSDQCSGRSAKAIFNSIAYWSSLSREKMEKLLKRGNIDINNISKLQQDEQLYDFAKKISPLYNNIHEEIQNSV